MAYRNTYFIKDFLTVGMYFIMLKMFLHMRSTQTDLASRTTIKIILPGNQIIYHQIETYTFNIFLFYFYIKQTNTIVLFCCVINFLLSFLLLKI